MTLPEFEEDYIRDYVKLMMIISNCPKCRPEFQDYMQGKHPYKKRDANEKA